MSPTSIVATRRPVRADMGREEKAEIGDLEGNDSVAGDVEKEEWGMKQPTDDIQDAPRAKINKYTIATSMLESRHDPMPVLKVEYKKK